MLNGCAATDRLTHVVERLGAAVEVIEQSGEVDQRMRGVGILDPRKQCARRSRVRGSRSRCRPTSSRGSPWRRWRTAVQSLVCSRAEQVRQPIAALGHVRRGPVAMQSEREFEAPVVVGAPVACRAEQRPHRAEHVGDRCRESRPVLPVRRRAMPRAPRRRVDRTRHRFLAMFDEQLARKPVQVVVLLVAPARAGAVDGEQARAP